MRIRELTLQNFRPFLGRQVINLQTEDSKPIILVKAMNDVGKTSIFKAMQFCLFGSKPTGEKLTSHINRTACLTGDGTTFVKMSFEHDGKTYDIIRSVDFTKSNLGGIPSVSQDNLEVIENGKPVTLKTTREQNVYIEAILPEDASQFFLFDGEEIQKYTLHPPLEKVKEAIEMVLGIRELLFAREDLEVIWRDLKHELDALLVKQQGYTKEALEVETLGKDVSELRKTIKDIEKRIQEAEENVKNCDETLSRNKTIQSKIELRKQAEVNCATIKEQIRTNDDKMREYNQHLGVILVAPLLQELSKATRTSIEHWKKNAMAALILSDLCICDRPMTMPITEKFQRQLDSEQNASVRHYIGEQATDLLLLAEPAALENKLSDILTQKSSLLSNLRLNEQTLDELNKEIGERKDLGKDIEAASDTRNRAAEDLRKYREEINQKKASWDFKNAEYNRRQEKLAAQSADKDVKEKSLCVKSSEECKAGINETIDKMVEKSKSRVAQLASEVFLKLTNAPSLYQGIEITDDYELRIKTVGGVVRPVWDQMPSAGQSQIIATAFIAALNKYSAREAPVVIDTPVGRLDPIHKNNLIKFYPELGSQVIILYQPNELTPADIAPIQKYVSSDWLFERDPHNPDATIIRRT